MLEKEEHVYRISQLGQIILSNKNGSYKTFNSNCFEQTFSVADTDAVLSKEEYEAFKELFEVVKE